jgi:nitroreductase
MDVYEAIRIRRSVRSFEDKAIPEETLTRIMEAARLAPSANNRQEWRFVVVRDTSSKRAIMEMAGNQKFIAQASVVLVCCAIDDGKVMHCGQRAYPIDVAIAIDHITLCAVAEGLGTCWIGHFDEAPVKRFLNIPEEVRVVELLPMGYPIDPTPRTKNRLPLKDIVMKEKWA